ncbi:MAG TPA: polymorphic toxin type 17 domain-containing protein [Tepidisphaeraceae bacterium]|nr:polymorphic toxin type 17 domain-containing protein [Tepidisphaeraceae bacterium]
MTKGDAEQPQSSRSTINDEEELKRVVLHQHHLPTGGEFPFVPPKQWWSHQPLPKNSKGEYIDIKYQRWRKGPSRTEGETWEWDVQLLNNDHLNIDWSGNITHPKPKAQLSRRQRHRGLGGKGKKRRKPQK